MVDRTWALSRNGQVTASLDYTNSAESRLGTIVRQNRRHRRPWIFISAYVPLLAIGQPQACFMARGPAPLCDL